MKKILLFFSNGSVGKICIDQIKKNKKYEKIISLRLNRNDNKRILLKKIKNFIFSKKKLDVILGFANISNLKKNEEIFGIISKLNINLINFYHETSIIDKSIKFGKGVKVFPGAIINRGCIIKNNVLINTGSIIEHDCFIGQHSQIAPGSVLAGKVRIGKNTLIGLGTKIIQGIKIGNNVIVGAGSVVIKNIPNNTTFIGVPAKKINEKN